jgi:ubiquinone/menaquinone biosynthesis C-methylase UbiE
MSKVGELLAWRFNQWFPRLNMHRTLETAKKDVSANQKWAMEETSRIVHAFFPYWDLKGKHVLDIGTGLGGELPYYIDAGARIVTGFDINPLCLEATKRHMETQGLASIVHLLDCDAASLPYPDNTFDAIISINVFEHIAQVELAVQEGYRVLRPGGLGYLHLPPYFSAWGSHLENWIHFPWPHLFFSEKTLMKVAERQDSLTHLNDQFVESAQIDWKAERIPGVNRVTLRYFRKLVLRAGFKILQLRLLPFGYDYLKSDNSILKKMAYGMLNTAAQTPLLQEAVVTKMAYVLQKASSK